MMIPLLVAMVMFSDSMTPANLAEFGPFCILGHYIGLLTVCPSMHLIS